jgi:endonuclease/exonuclease/phosphatase (EEP) superfamily protein YafD
MDALIAHVPTVQGPHVVAGDLNTTTFRPKVQELLDTGLVDAHESLGEGLSASFKLAADGVLAAPGAVVRLDHALLSENVRAISADDLPSEGSDHVPFAVTLAVRPGAHP